MANETETGLIVHDPAAEALAELAAKPFDPATLLEAPAPRPPIALEGTEALPYAAGRAAEVVRAFDPATLLGDAARRGPATIGDGKPLVARIGGVEVVTIPLEHYAALLSPLALVKDGAGAGLDAEGMFDLLMRALNKGEAIALDDVQAATGLDMETLSARVVEWVRAQPTAIEQDNASVEIASPPEAAAVDLPSGAPTVSLTAREVAASYDAAAKRGDTPGGAMDREGRSTEPTGKGEAAYDAERGSHKRSRK